MIFFDLDWIFLIAILLFIIGAIYALINSLFSILGWILAFAVGCFLLVIVLSVFVSGNVVDITAIVGIIADFCFFVTKGIDYIEVYVSTIDSLKISNKMSH
jgi:hypothetical protein